MGAKIFVLDDDRVILEVVRELFAQRGHEVFASLLWSEVALPLMTGSSHSEPTALVCDLSMPGIRGEDFIRIVRSYDTELPIVLLTGEPAEVAQAAAESTGANAHVSKRDMATLVPTVERLIRARERRAGRPPAAKDAR